MKFAQKHFTFVIFCMTIIFLFQSCTIYNFQKYSLDEAVKREKRTKIVYKTGERLRCKKIILVDGKYYCLKRKDSFLLDQNDIKKVKIKNTTASIISTVLVGSVALITIGALTTDWSSIGSSAGASF